MSGATYGWIDFVDRLLPKSASVDGNFAKAVLDGLKRLVVVQNENPWVTLNPTVSAGIWVFYRTRRCWLINPAQAHLRVETAYRQKNDVDIGKHLREAVARGEVTKTDKKEFDQFVIRDSALSYLWDFFEQLEKPANVDLNNGDIVGRHPRYFPGEARQMALEQFIADGRICPGVDGHAKSHKLAEFDQTEFDHILPFSLGGPSTYQNLQILCTSCNRIKGARAS